MARFRKKPVEINAFQMTKKHRLSNEHWPMWMHEAWNKDDGTPGSLYPITEGIKDGALVVGTHEGELLVSWDDWIIQGVNGELDLCKPDIFEQTYESVD